MIRAVAVIACLCLALGQAKAQPSFFPLKKKGTDGYLALAPADTAKALLLIVPPPGMGPEEVLQDSALSSAASSEGLVLVSIPHPEQLLLTPGSFRFMTEALGDALKRFKIPADKVAIGGIREGGILAMQFTQECWAAPQFYPNRPRVLFGVETPVDLSEWWNSCDRDLVRNSSPEAVAASVYWMQVLKKELGGAPDTLPAEYARRSPFLMGNEQTGKERFLMPVAMRLYYGGDIQASIRERHRALCDLPVAPASALLQRLVQNGHGNAEIRLTCGSGGAWGNTDKTDCIHWVAASLSVAAAKE